MLQGAVACRLLRVGAYLFVWIGGLVGLAAERLVSAGGVVYRTVDGGFEVALILNDGVWCLPKGLVEDGESFEETAFREVHEETGLKGELAGKIGEISYSFVRNKRYFKTVHFFLFEFVGGSFEAHDSEVDDVAWFSFPRAFQVMVYPAEKKMLAKADEMLKKLNKVQVR